MLTVMLNDVRIFAHHGLYHEESVTGTEFSVSVAVDIDIEKVASISDTVDYTDVFNIVRRHFSRPVPLLEMLAEKIAADVKTLHAEISSVEISITKTNPPIRHLTGSAGIKLKKIFT